MIRPWFVILALTPVFAGDSNRIKSLDYLDKNERISILKKHVKLRSAVKDAQFDIYDVNLNTGSSIPGPTHRDYRIALALQKADTKKWLSDVIITSFPHDTSWCHILIAGKENFKLAHQADMWTYTGKNKVVFYFEKDAVLCMRIYQQ